jgi:hypothetical protein
LEERDLILASFCTILRWADLQDATRTVEESSAVRLDPGSCRAVVVVAPPCALSRPRFDTDGAPQLREVREVGRVERYSPFHGVALTEDGNLHRWSTLEGVKRGAEIEFSYQEDRS